MQPSARVILASFSFHESNNRIDWTGNRPNEVVLRSQVLCGFFRDDWLYCRRCLSAMIGVFGSQLKKTHEHLIFFLGQLFDGAPARFAHYSIDDGLLQLGCDVWSS